MQVRRILSLQPYYGESHRQFIDGWVEQSQHHWHLLTLPGRHWKWRMRHAAVEFTEQMKTLAEAGESFDAIVTTDMLNAAELKGLLVSACPEYCRLPLVVYFHENQFAYPSQFGEGSAEHQRDQHFGFTNFLSTLAADQVWFNSTYNQTSMLHHLENSGRRWPDYAPKVQVGRLREKFSVEPPGIEKPPIDVASFSKLRSQRRVSRNPTRIVWAARWEHDKNPQLLLDSLRHLKTQTDQFEISVIGQSFRKHPKAFDDLEAEFKTHIRHWGFVPDRNKYWEVLAESDVFVSTASHEFFGIAAAEAISVGLHPLFPNALAYPEMIQRLIASAKSDPLGQELNTTDFLYEVGGDSATDLASRLVTLASRPEDLGPAVSEATRSAFLEQLVWSTRAKAMDQRLAELATARM